MGECSQQEGLGTVRHTARRKNELPLVISFFKLLYKNVLQSKMLRTY